MSTPTAIAPGWYQRESIEGLPGGALLTYAYDDVRFEHVCDRGPRGVIVCAPALQLGHGHTIIHSSHGGSTVTPSILCEDCGIHGFVTDGHWNAA